VCIVGTQLIFFPQVRLVVAGEVACLLVILGGLEWGRRTHVQQRWISARYLAERLRSAFFLALAGTGEEPSPSPFISTDIPAAPWVGTAFRMVWIRRPPLQVDGIPVASLRRFLSDAWIDDQRDYFERASERAGSAHLFSTRAVEILFALSVVIAIVHVTMPGPEDWFKHIVSLLAISIPACAAALVGYNAQREHLRNSQRYGRMVDGLVRANALMLAAGDQAHIRDVASTVDRMLREERGEWFGTVRLYELELPA